MEKVRSLIKPIQPWTTAGEKRQKRDMRSLIVFRTRTKKKEMNKRMEWGISSINRQTK
jgi:hypothetical protein